MRLYINSPNNKKIYLNIIAPTRTELRNMIGDDLFHIEDVLYSVNNVYAERGKNETATGAVVGGLVGALAGPVGIILGGVIGGLIGNSTDEDENVKIARFNNS